MRAVDAIPSVACPAWFTGICGGGALQPAALQAVQPEVQAPRGGRPRPAVWQPQRQVGTGHVLPCGRPARWAGPCTTSDRTSLSCVRRLLLSVPPSVPTLCRFPWGTLGDIARNNQSHRVGVHIACSDACPSCTSVPPLTLSRLSCPPSHVSHPSASPRGLQDQLDVAFKELRLAFQAMDLDGDGVVDREEFTGGATDAGHWQGGRDFRLDQPNWWLCSVVEARPGSSPHL